MLISNISVTRHYHLLCLSMIVLLSHLSSFLYAQQIEHVIPEMDGNKIVIYYDLVDTTEQIYTVTISCSINDGGRFVLQNVTGEIGPGITAGKRKKIVWDAYKEVERIENIQFFIRAERTGGPLLQPSPMLYNSPSTSDKNKSNKQAYVYIGYYGSLTDVMGIRLAYQKNWGVYGAYKSYGLADYSVLAGGSRKISDIISIYLGVGLGDWGWKHDDYFYWDNYYGFETEVGVVVAIKWAYASIGTTLLWGHKYIGEIKVVPDLTFGAGIRF